MLNAPASGADEEGMEEGELERAGGGGGGAGGGGACRAGQGHVEEEHLVSSTRGGVLVAESPSAGGVIGVVGGSVRGAGRGDGRARAVAFEDDALLPSPGGVDDGVRNGGPDAKRRRVLRPQEDGAGDAHLQSGGTGRECKDAVGERGTDGLGGLCGDGKEPQDESEGATGKDEDSWVQVLLAEKIPLLHERALSRRFPSPLLLAIHVTAACVQTRVRMLVATHVHAPLCTCVYSPNSLCICARVIDTHQMCVSPRTRRRVENTQREMCARITASRPLAAVAATNQVVTASRLAFCGFLRHSCVFAANSHLCVSCQCAQSIFETPRSTVSALTGLSTSGRRDGAAVSGERGGAGSQDSWRASRPGSQGDSRCASCVLMCAVRARVLACTSEVPRRRLRFVDAVVQRVILTCPGAVPISYPLCSCARLRVQVSGLERGSQRCSGHR